MSRTRIIRWLRAAALLIGYPIVVLLGLALVLLTLRVAQVTLFYSPRAPEHMAEKEAYLASIRPVDPARAPNFVVIFFDDLGWGDLSVQGSRLIRTPHIDRIAERGLRATQFYSGSPVCTPSRAALLTGRYPPRANIDGVVYFPTRHIAGLVRRVIGQGNELPRDEILLPEVLGAAGYATGMIGKWHVGELAGHRPTDFGFQSYFGVMWSNDMWPLHLFRNDEIIERDERPASWFGQRDEERPLGPGGVDQSRLTERYASEAIGFLERNRDQPFFLYLAHTFPHVPHYASPDHAGDSAGGLYGDVVEDLDRATGAVHDALERLGLAENTLVLITSDNGADYGGSAGELRGRKAEIYEGGQRVPMIAHWPGRVPAGVVSDEMAMNIDIFPTLLGLAGLPLPDDRAIDGRDLGSLLTRNAPSPHDYLFYFPIVGSEPGAVRDATFKYLASTKDPGRDRPHLTRIAGDVEAHDQRAHHPDVAAELAEVLEAKRVEFRTNARGWR